MGPEMISLGTMEALLASVVGPSEASADDVVFPKHGAWLVVS